MPRYHVKITGRDYPAMADLVLKYKVHVARHTVEKLAKGYRVDAQVDGRQLRVLETAGYKVKRVENIDKEGKKRQQEVRAAKKAAKKKLVGSSIVLGPVSPVSPIPPIFFPTYLTVDEVEQALTNLSQSPNNTFTSIIKLPNPTWEKRACCALKVGKGTGNNRPGIYFLGGVHAREWGSPDILINFLRMLIHAYNANTQVVIGSNTFTAAQIKKIVETKDVYVFPQCNPEGRHYSMNS